MEHRVIYKPNSDFTSSTLKIGKKYKIDSIYSYDGKLDINDGSTFRKENNKFYYGKHEVEEIVIGHTFYYIEDFEIDKQFYREQRLNKLIDET